MILIALGSNLPSAAGTPAETLAAALSALEANDVRPLKVSRFYRSDAWPDPREPPFVNAVAQIGTTLHPSRLLEVLHGVERSFGRERAVRNAPRTLDIDVLDYDGRVESGPPVLPHPRMEDRAFVLVPLAEIKPQWRHPVSQCSVAQLLVALADGASGVRPLSSTPPVR